MRCNGFAFIRSGFGRILLYVGFGDSERVQLAYTFPVVLPVWFGRGTETGEGLF